MRAVINDVYQRVAYVLSTAIFQLGALFNDNIFSIF